MGQIPTDYPPQKALWLQRICTLPEFPRLPQRFNGTRIMVSVVLDNLAAGVAVEELLRSYPSLSREAVQATVAYAADLARERVVPMPA